jgi:hypothetical protein
MKAPEERERGRFHQSACSVFPNATRMVKLHTGDSSENEEVSEYEFDS